MSKNGAAVIVDILKAENVEYVFTLPGTTILDIYDAAYEDKDIKLIVTRHEQVAVFMADGYARASGQSGVCLVSRGPGAANIVIGLHNAHEESVPVVAIVGDVISGISQRDCFEEMDLETLLRPVTKRVYRIDSAQRIAELLPKAIKDSMKGRKRPVGILIPQNVQREAYDITSNTSTLNIARACCSRETARIAAEMLVESLMPAIFVGGGVVASGATMEIRALAHTLGIPVVTTWLRTDSFPNDDVYFLGSTGPGAFESTLEYMRAADTVFAVGCRFSEFSTQGYSLLSSECKLVHMDTDAQELGKVYDPALGIVADALQGCQLIREEVETMLAGEGYRKIPSPLAGNALAKFRVESKLPLGEDDKGRVFSGNVIRVLQRMLPKDAMIVCDTATFGPWVTRYFGFTEPGSLIAPAGGCLGFGFPAAMGAKLACPSRPVVCLVGDGGFSMVLQDLETAVRYDIAIIVLVMNNCGYGNIRSRQLSEYGGRFIGCSYGNPDFAALARLYGIDGRSARNTSELEAGLNLALEAKAPYLIDIMLGPDAGMPPGVVPPPSGDRRPIKAEK